MNKFPEFCFVILQHELSLDLFLPNRNSPCWSVFFLYSHIDDYWLWLLWRHQYSTHFDCMALDKAGKRKPILFRMKKKTISIRFIVIANRLIIFCLVLFFRTRHVKAILVRMRTWTVFFFPQYLQNSTSRNSNSSTACLKLSSVRTSTSSSYVNSDSEAAVTVATSRHTANRNFMVG